MTHCSYTHNQVLKNDDLIGFDKNNLLKVLKIMLENTILLSEKSESIFRVLI